MLGVGEGEGGKTGKQVSLGAMAKEDFRIFWLPHEARDLFSIFSLACDVISVISEVCEWSSWRRFANLNFLLIFKPDSIDCTFWKFPSSSPYTFQSSLHLALRSPCGILEAIWSNFDGRKFCAVLVSAQQTVSLAVSSAVVKSPDSESYFELPPKNSLLRAHHVWGFFSLQFIRRKIGKNWRHDLDTKSKLWFISSFERLKAVNIEWKKV